MVDADLAHFCGPRSTLLTLSLPWNIPGENSGTGWRTPFLACGRGRGLPQPLGRAGVQGSLVASVFIPILTLVPVGNAALCKTNSAGIAETLGCLQHCSAREAAWCHGDSTGSGPDSLLPCEPPFPQACPVDVHTTIGWWWGSRKTKYGKQLALS